MTSRSKKSKQLQNYELKKKRLKTQIGLLNELAELSSTKNSEHLSPYVSPVTFFNEKNKNAKKCTKVALKNKDTLDVNEAELQSALRQSRQHKKQILVGQDSKDGQIQNDSESLHTDDMSTDSEENIIDVKENIDRCLKSDEIHDLAHEPKTSGNLIESHQKIHAIPLKSVTVKRTKAIQEARLKLPILAEEFEIVDKIRTNVFTVVSGATGSGKTTQIPQFLYEAGYSARGMIGITEPRRVAATSIAKRVAQEIGNHRSVVGHQVKFDNQVTEKTKIKFMTDGILIQEMKGDFMLSKYSVIIIDEAHERSLFTDVLIGLLSRIAMKRSETDNPLKVVIMSATLYLLEFVQNQKLFKEFQPPIIEIESRQFKNTIHYSKHTPEDFIQAAYQKIIKIDRSLPNGTILVFLTSKAEVHELCELITKSNQGQTIKPIPFHSMLSPEKQSLVFADYTDTSLRVCVISTNIAETSITIPNVKYVLDCGKVKSKHYSPVTGTERYEVGWISKASAAQRAGRAGRVCEGHVYRLYSHALYGGMAEHSEPEILKSPISQMVLQLKCLGVHKIENFPFPTSPPMQAVREAENELVELGLLDMHVDDSNVKVMLANELGQNASLLPIAPKFAKIVLTSIKYSQSVIYWTVSLVACLSVGEIFTDKKCQKQFTTKFKPANQIQSNAGDLMTYIHVIGLVLHDKTSFSKYSISRKSFNEIKQLQKSLFKIMTDIWNTNDLSDSYLPNPPSNNELAAILKSFLSGSSSNLAYQVLMQDNENSIAQHKSNPRYQSINSPENHYLLHNSSVLKPKPSQIIAYISKLAGTTSKTYMLDCFAIDTIFLVEEFPEMCNSINPLKISNTIIANDQSLKTVYMDGCVKYWDEIVFGPQRWNLGHVLVPLKKGLALFLRFAMHIVQLEVFSGSSENFNSKNLVDQLKKNGYEPKNTNVLTLKYYKMHQYSKGIVCKLIEKDVCDKSTLMKALSANKQFLMREFAAWYPVESHQIIQDLWEHLKLK